MTNTIKVDLSTVKRRLQEAVEAMRGPDMTRQCNLYEMPALMALILKWEQSARCAFADAKQETDPFGRRFIEHGAMCYFNCARDLRAVADASELPLSDTPTTDQK